MYVYIFAKKYLKLSSQFAHATFCSCQMSHALKVAYIATPNCNTYDITYYQLLKYYVKCSCYAKKQSIETNIKLKQKLIKNLNEFYPLLQEYIEKNQRLALSSKCLPQFPNQLQYSVASTHISLSRAHTNTPSQLHQYAVIYVSMYIIAVCACICVCLLYAVQCRLAYLVSV